MSKFKLTKHDNTLVEGLSDIKLSCSPGSVVFNDLIYVFYQGEGAHGNLYYSVYNPKTDKWTTVQKKIKDHVMTESPSAAVYNGKIYLTFQDYEAKQIVDGYTFDPVTNILTEVDSRYASVYSQTKPILVEFKNHFFNFEQQKEYEGKLGSLRSYMLEGTTKPDFHKNVVWELKCMSCSPAAIANGDNLDVFVQNYSENGELRWLTFSGAENSKNEFKLTKTSSQLVPSAQMTGSPSVAILDAFEFVFYQGSNSNGDVTRSYRALGSDSWSEVNVVDWFNSITDSPTTVTYDKTIYLFCRDYGNGSGLQLCTLSLG
ncbi:MAG: hypothetical protein GQ574_13330 [Crocinitomix sp.]|nr:hypothetical protein [Crocinitomix sp.]